MDGYNYNRRPGQQRQRRPNSNHRRGPAEHPEGGLPQRDGNRRNNPPANNQRRAPSPRNVIAIPGGIQLQQPENQGANNFFLRQGEERQNVAGRNRNQGAPGNHQAPHGGRRWNERENKPRGRNANQGVGRGLHPDQENPPLQRKRQEESRGHDSQDGPQHPRCLGYRTVENLLEKEPSEIVITLTYSTGMKELLNQSQIHQNFLQLICKVLSKACKSRTDRQSLQHLLGLLKNSDFLKICLPQYVVKIMTDPVPSRRQQYPEHIDNIVCMLQELVSVFPASSVQETSMLVSVLQPAVNALRATGVSISDQTEKNLEKVQNIIQHLQEKRREGTLKSDTYIYMDAEEDVPDNYRTMAIYPTYEEVHQEDKPFLRPNIISGKYASTEIYLDTHFRLLREDFLRPLREGIMDLLHSYDDQGLRRRRFDDIRVYFDTRIIAPLCTSAGIVYKVQFDIKPLKFVRWQNSKRLIYGSLVCMSKDNFETLLFATVSDRDVEELHRGVIQLRFNENSRLLLTEVQPSDSFLMVETTAYFEAYKHVLEGLQKTTEEDLPFQKYIVECDSDIREPSYLRFGDMYDLNSLIAEVSSDTQNGLEKSAISLKKEPVFNVLEPAAWPSSETLSLDESQMEALQLALTKELAIIQGPPGTGKTFVGLKIVKALLSNKHVWQGVLQKSSILVVCYTNHALDQFLEGIYQFLEDGIVRVGGRSNSELLKRFTLRELRQKREFRKNLPSHLRWAYVGITNEMKESEQKIVEGSKHLECTTRGIIHEQYLEKYIEPQHWDSLLFGLANEEEHVFTTIKQSMILEWLGLGFTAFVQTGAQNAEPGAENADLQQDPEAEEDEEEDLLEIAEEADLIQADRLIEEDHAKHRKRNENAIKELANLLLAMNLENQSRSGKQNMRNIAEEQQDGEWKVQRNQKKKMKQKIRNELRKTSAMSQTEAMEVVDVWSLSLNDRWRLYRLWLQMYQADIKMKILQYEQQFQAAVDRLAELRVQEDLHLLKGAKVVGMTTTGAAKFRQILQEVKPQIVVVEEAAEVLEAHTITTLSSACQHLILIGDHQQLRPSATVFDLAKNFNLEVSLFERLVKMNFPYVRLNYQHRMRPDIARLLTPHIYDQLENHPSVQQYENIKGVSSNLFFVEHTFPEQELQDGKSHQNQHEAEFVVALCQYLICQGYSPSQITILTTYTGQLFCLRKLLPIKKFHGVKVHVVDKYQGEENDIILLSLVRSNRQGKVGFLQIANRICVALSRAKKGLYCIGNMEMLGKVPLWSKIIYTLREKGQIGQSLMLFCQNHPETMTLVSKAEDFSKVPEGGCNKPCEFRLDCGHVCTRACHPYDTDHKEFQCIKPCQKILCDREHRCTKLCFEKCGQCLALVEKTVPKCGHLQMIPCSTKPETFSCLKPCTKTLYCGHKCLAACGEKCTEKCPEKMKLMLKCGHNQEEDCYKKQDMILGIPLQCKTKCEIRLACGHACSGNCHSCFEGRFHNSCKSPCKRLLICSHECLEPCTNDCPPCERHCKNRCVHSKCEKKCGELCVPCVEPCEWRCEHYQCKKLCSEPCDRPPCNQPCRKQLNCGHPCIGLCGEPCPKKCRVCNKDEVTEIFFGFEEEDDARFVQLEDCMHIVEVSGLDHYMNMKEEDGSSAVKLKVCPKCQTPIRKNLRYGTTIKKLLGEIEKVKAKINGSINEIELNRERLKNVLKEANTIALNLKLENKQLQTELQRSDLSMKSINLIENKIAFYKRLAELKSKQRMSIEERTEFKTRLEQCQEWLLKPRVRFTGQELSDLQSEVQRLTYLAELNVRCKMASGRITSSVESEVSSVRKVLQSTKRFSEQDETFVKGKMVKLKSVLVTTGLGISESERVAIVKAMGLRQGHWYKCPNGHVYAITECGGATERRKCPDCDAVIGGQDHALEQGNEVATEMDGARHAAWSNTANNMMNFEQLF
uniref:Zinc finger NFX1-type containing 1 n=1 Tax=Latimeria chalumnae TaxID=7897 RepID=M3XK12_LATCH|nr:PREDICTED: NFX1-type zinc finger-containing protein 1 [Latimeria chalumnae]|eukprot:XP_006003202.1 PREDICTED: NFX1-type zinc finger-containing protein 1 [Latimeria chalumnae]